MGVNATIAFLRPLSDPVLAMKLPEDLLLAIAAHLPSLADLHSLSSTSVSASIAFAPIFAFIPLCSVNNPWPSLHIETRNQGLASNVQISACNIHLRRYSSFYKAIVVSGAPSSIGSLLDGIDSPDTIFETRFAPASVFDNESAQEFLLKIGRAKLKLCLDFRLLEETSGIIHTLSNYWSNWDIISIKFGSLARYSGRLDLYAATALFDTSPQTLKHVVLSCLYVDDEIANTIAQKLPLTKIETLDLSRNAIRSAGALAIAKALPNTNIQYLNLNDNFVGPEGAMHLSHYLPSSKVRKLEIAYNEINNQGVKYIGTCLKFSKNLHFLNLSKNKVSDSGIIQFALAMLQGTYLKQLNLSYNYFGDEGAGFISHVLLHSNIQSLDIRGNAISLNSLRQFMNWLALGKYYDLKYDI